MQSSAVLFLSLLTSVTCTSLSNLGYIASSGPVRNVLISTGLGKVIRSSAESLYDASGYRYRSDHGTAIRRATMNGQRIVEVDTQTNTVLQRDKDEHPPRGYGNAELENSERLFGVLHQMDKKACIAKLMCEIGAEPLSYGAMGWKISRYLKAVPPVKWNSKTYPYIESFQGGSLGGRVVCKQHYTQCTSNLKSVMDFLFYFIRPLHA